MRPQTSSWVFCALLLSTLGHQILTQHRPDQRSKKQLTRYESKDNDQDITKPRPSFVNATVHLLTNPKTNLVAIVNVTGEVAVVYDLNCNYVVAFSGADGGFLAVNLETKVGVSILGNSSTRYWLSGLESFACYFNNLTSLKSFYDEGLKDGDKFKLGDVSYYLELQLQWNIAAFSRNEFSVSESEAFRRFIEYSSTLISTLNGPLKGLLSILGNNVRTISLNMRSLPVVLQGLASIVCKVEGGISALKCLDWNVVFNAKSGCHLFIYIFSQLKAHNINARAILLKYSQTFIVLINQLSGNSSNNLNGVVKIITESYRLALRQSSIVSLIQALTEYFGEPNNRAKNFTELQKEFQRLLDFFRNFDLTKDYKEIIELLTGILQGDYTIRNVNIHEIVRTLFISSSKPPIHHVVQILEYCRDCYRIEVSCGILLYHLIVLSIDGVRNVVLALVPKIKMDYSINKYVYIFRGVKISDLKKDLYNALSGLHVIGPILDVMDESLRYTSGVTFNKIFLSPDFSPYGQAITKLVERQISKANEAGQSNLVEAGKQLKQQQGFENKHLMAANKETKRNHLANNARHKDKKHDHASEKTHGSHTKHHVTEAKHMTHEAKHQEGRHAKFARKHGSEKNHEKLRQNKLHNGHTRRHGTN